MRAQKGTRNIQLKSKYAEALSHPSPGGNKRPKQKAFDKCGFFTLKAAHRSTILKHWIKHEGVIENCRAPTLAGNTTCVY